MSRGVRMLIVLVVAVVLAGIASFAVYQRIQRIPVREVEVASVSVLVAAKPLPVGALLGPDDVRLAAWPAKNPVAGALTSAEAAVGRGLLVGVAENEPVTEGKLAPREAGAGLAPTIPLGMRAISVKVNEVIGVAGFVVPGTRVDVLATVTRSNEEPVTRTVVSNIQVLAAGTRIDQEQAKDGKPIPATVVTLLATPEDAERLTLASTEGKVLLVLRNPLDGAPTSTAGVRMGALVGPPAPPPVERAVQGRRVIVAAPPPPPPPPPPQPYVVEAIRGAKRATEEVRK